MATQNGSFPHPVIGVSDDVSSSIDVSNPLISFGVEDIEIKFRFRTDDDQVKRLIEDGKAIVVASWSCSSTLNRDAIKLSIVKSHVDGFTYSGLLDQLDVARKVNVSISLVATQILDEFRWNNQHPDYEGQTFKLLKGDLLGLAGNFSFLANKLYDPMQPPLGSCFRVVRDSTLKKDIRVDFDDDEQVIIRTPIELSNGIDTFSDRPDIQISLVILPALMETISFIHRNEMSADSEDLSDRTWFNTVKDMLEINNSDITKPFEAAQKILGNPTAEVLTSPLLDEDD